MSTSQEHDATKSADNLVAQSSGPTRGVVSFSAGDYWYHSHSHADFQICRELAKTRPVLIVNSLGMRMPSMASSDGLMRVWRKLKSTTRAVRRPSKNVTVLSPIFLPIYGTSRAAAFNQQFVRAQVRLVSRLFGPFPDRIVANPTSWAIADGLGSGPIVLYRVDHFSATEDVDTKRIEALEDVAFAGADVVLYASAALMRKEAGRHGGKGQLFEHGVDLSVFNVNIRYDEPTDLSEIPHPRVVMMGSLEKADRVEQTLDIAAELPDVQFVLIGGGARSSNFRTLPNVHFLGEKKPDQLPAYLAHIDVGLVVVARSEWGVAASPIKLKEYLAMGLPVVSTWFDGVDELAELVRFGSTTTDVAEALRTTLSDLGPGSREDRLQFIDGQGWEAKTQRLVQILDALHAQRPSR
jgi:glycosyltransferase involved in cell wall biosynthesis